MAKISGRVLSKKTVQLDCFELSDDVGEPEDIVVLTDWEADEYARTLLNMKRWNNFIHYRAMYPEG